MQLCDVIVVVVAALSSLCYFILVTLYEMIEKTFQLIRKHGFHAKTENERFR